MSPALRGSIRSLTCIYINFENSPSKKLFNNLLQSAGSMNISTFLVWGGGDLAKITHAG
jgi:hypothetical protein